MKKPLKFALPALLLSAGVLAYAAGEVTLANKAILNWENFVENVNTPPQVEGTLAADDPAVTGKASAEAALKAAKTALSTAKSNLEAAEKTKKEMDDAETEAQTALKNAQSDVTAAESTQSTAQTAASTAATNYSTAQRNVTSWSASLNTANKAVSDLNKTRTTQQKTVDDIEAQIKTKYADAIEGYQTQIDANDAAYTEVMRYTGLMNALVSYTYEQQPQLWLQNVKSDVATVSSNYKASGSNTVKLYYDYLFDEDENEAILRLYFGDSVPSISAISKDGWQQISAPDLFAKFKGSNFVNQVYDLYVYLGKTDDKYNYGTDGLLPVTLPSTGNNLIRNITTAINTLIESGRYMENVGDPTKTISNQALYDEYEKSKTEYEAKIKEYTNDNGETITGYAAVKEALENKIKTLKAAEATDPLQSQLKSAKDALEQTDKDIEAKEAEADGYDKLLAPYNNKTGKNPIDENDTTEYKDGDTLMTGLEILHKLQEDTAAALTAANSAVTTAQKAESAAQTALSNAKADATAAETRVTNLTSSVNTAETNQSTAQTSYNTALAAYNAAQAAADAAATAAAFEPYKNVTLNGNVTATTTINSYSGTINGGGYIIDVPEDSCLFDTFSGRMSNVAINGTTVNHNDGARFTNVVRWDGTTGKTYDADGAGIDYTGAKAFGAFGFAIRDNKNFGVSFNDGKIVAAAAAPSKVYDITVNDYNIDVNSKRNTQYYVQQVGGNLINIANDTVTIPDNRFAKSATDDLSGVDNVYYTDGESNLCDNVVIKDKVDFYAPVQIDATSVKYDRTFKSNEDVALRFSAVCLPFALASGDDYDVFKFEKVENKKFWFTQTNSVAANKPALIRLKNATALEGLDLGETVIAQTTAQIVTFDGASNSPSISYGTFKSVKAGEFNGQSQIGYIYGLNTSGKFQAASSNASFAAFRMVVSTTESVFPLNAPRRAPGEYVDEYEIGILDEDGNDITDQIMNGSNITGVEDVADLSFGIYGGQGVITITSDADYGTVPVYSLDGKVVATADVVAGTTTTVNLQNGVYIVLGKKVLVK